MDERNLHQMSSPKIHMNKKSKRKKRNIYDSVITVVVVLFICNLMIFLVNAFKAVERSLKLRLSFLDCIKWIQNEEHAKRMENGTTTKQMAKTENDMNNILNLQLKK